MLNYNHTQAAQFKRIYKAAQHAILTGSVMVGAIGLGRLGLEGFLYVFMLAVAVSAVLIYSLLFLVILPLHARQPNLDSLSVALCSMGILPLFTFVIMCVVFGRIPNLQVSIVWIPLIASVVYGALTGAHLKRLEDQAQSQRADCLVDTSSSAL